MGRAFFRSSSMRSILSLRASEATRAFCRSASAALRCAETCCAVRIMEGAFIRLRSLAVITTLSVCPGEPVAEALMVSI